MPHKPEFYFKLFLRIQNFDISDLSIALQLTEKFDTFPLKDASLDSAAPNLLVMLPGQNWAGK